MARYRSTRSSSRRGPSLAVPNRRASMPTQCPPGQHLRGGKMIVAIGGPAPTPVAAGATAVITYQIPESGRVGRLILQETLTGDLFSTTLDGVRHNNVELTSQTCPAEQFSALAVGGSNPIFGRWLLTNDQLQITLTNTTAATPLAYVSSFSVM